MVSGKRVAALFLSLFCVLAAGGWSTERMPWVGNYLEFEWRNALLYQSYSKIAKEHHCIDRSSNDLFFMASLSNALKPEFAAEVELTLANTRKQNWGVDNLRLTGRYVWLDELLGDPLTLTAGASLSYCSRASLHDISSFHHGRGEAELFVSFGHEKSFTETWDSRWWGLLGLGFADRGKPWLHAELAYDQRFRSQHEGSLFIQGLCGQGEKRLRIQDFDGYGPIHHRSLDVGGRYTYLIEFFGSFSLEYSYRLYACNFPAHTHQILARLLYTFGL